MTKKKCAWYGADGMCKNEFICSKYKKRIMCKSVKNCKKFATNKKTEKLLAAKSCDREVTPLTRRLVKMYHDEGDTVNQIAFVLQRSPKAIKEILEGK